VRLRKEVQIDIAVDLAGRGRLVVPRRSPIRLKKGSGRM
jgi:hypothetical protein